MNKQVYADVMKRANGECEVCHRSANLELHHILRRKVTATRFNCTALCSECHRGTFGIHGKNGHDLDMKLKLQVQEGYFLVGKDEDEVRELIGGRLYDISN